MSDKYGRRVGLIGFSVIAGLLFILNGFLQNQSYLIFSVCQMLLIAFCNAACLTHFVYGMEIMGPRYRSAAGMLSQCFFSLGFMALTPVGIIVSKASGFMYFGAFIPALIIPVLPLLRESFRWQFANGMHQEGKTTLKSKLLFFSDLLIVHKIRLYVEMRRPI